MCELNLEKDKCDAEGSKRNRQQAVPKMAPTLARSWLPAFSFPTQTQEHVSFKNITSSLPKKVSR